MCGIVGVLTQDDNLYKILIDSLNRLSYRGYDSAGIATVSDIHQIECVKSIGDIAELEKKVININIKSKVGIAHTRWATHGSIALKNAHPHCTNEVAVVHNGVIENYHHVKKELELEGFNFISDTDSELVPVLINQIY